MLLLSTEKRLKEDERELKRKEKKKEKQELAQKRMAQKGLREAEKENADGSHTKVKYIVLTDEGRAFDPEAAE